jgi:hypothetical protein
VSEFEDIVAEVLREWNKAEKAIKQAENVDGEVVIPAIFELRYAGRRLIEALECKDKDPGRAIELIRDTLFFCHRSRHDAIDAATSKMAGDLGVATEYLSAAILMQNFPDFSEFYAEMLAVRQRMAESREKRNDRDAIYASIEANNLDRLVELYSRFRACEPLMLRAMEQENADREQNRNAARRGNVIGIVGVVVAVIGIIVGVVVANSG